MNFLIGGAAAAGWAGAGRGSGWLAAGCDVCPAAPNCRCDTRTFVSSLLNQHLKGKCGINVGQSALISGNKIVRTIRAVRVTAVSSVTSQLTWQLYSPPSAASCCKSLSLGCWLLTSAPQFGRSHITRIRTCFTRSFIDNEMYWIFKPSLSEYTQQIVQSQPCSDVEVRLAPHQPPALCL